MAPPLNKLRIETGVPIPAGSPRGIAAVILAMVKGESCVMPLENRHAVWAVGRRKNIELTTRKLSNGKFRVWRTA